MRVGVQHAPDNWVLAFMMGSHHRLSRLEEQSRDCFLRQLEPGLMSYICQLVGLTAPLPEWCLSVRDSLVIYSDPEDQLQTDQLWHYSTFHAVVVYWH